VSCHDETGIVINYARRPIYGSFVTWQPRHPENREGRRDNLDRPGLLISRSSGLFQGGNLSQIQWPVSLQAVLVYLKCPAAQICGSQSEHGFMCVAPWPIIQQSQFIHPLNLWYSVPTQKFSSDQLLVGRNYEPLARVHRLLPDARARPQWV